jgi:hypothetical protein
MKNVKVRLMTNAADCAWLMVQSGGFQQQNRWQSDDEIQQETGGFQSQVNVSPAPGVAGDFCSNNPRFTVDAGPGGLVAGPNGVTVGNFAWFNGLVDTDGTPTQVSSSWNGWELYGWSSGQTYNQVAGFVGRNQQGLITTFLSDASMVIPAGFPMFLYSGGDFWVKNTGSVQALPGMKAYANLATGAVAFNTTGNAPGGATGTGPIIVQNATFTASITGNLMTVTAIASGGGNIQPGMTITGTAGGTIAASSAITYQVSGSVGGTGVYVLNVPEQTYSSATVSGSIGQLSIGTLTSGTFGVGQILNGTGVAPNTVITALAGATGGTGLYWVTPGQTMSSSPVNTTGYVETKWMATSSGLTGEIVKITSHVYG